MSLCDRKYLPDAGNFFLQYKIHSYDRKFLLPSIFFYVTVIFFLYSFCPNTAKFVGNIFRLQEISSCNTKFVLLTGNLFFPNRFVMWQLFSSGLHITRTQIDFMGSRIPVKIPRCAKHYTNLPRVRHLQLSPSQEGQALLHICQVPRNLSGNF